MHRSRTGNTGSTAFNGEDPARFQPEPVDPNYGLDVLKKKLADLCHAGTGKRRVPPLDNEIYTSCVEVIDVTADEDDPSTVHVDLHFGVDSESPLLETLRSMERIVAEANRKGLLR